MRLAWGAPRECAGNQGKCSNRGLRGGGYEEEGVGRDRVQRRSLVHSAQMVGERGTEGKKGKHTEGNNVLVLLFLSHTVGVSALVAPICTALCELRRNAVEL